MLAYNIQTLVNHPEESIQRSEQARVWNQELRFYSTKPNYKRCITKDKNLKIEKLLSVPYSPLFENVFLF
jgi:hypothetical protein